MLQAIYTKNKSKIKETLVKFILDTASMLIVVSIVMLVGVDFFVKLTDHI